MQQYIVSSFISKSGGGNKAAVVFDDFGVSDQKMLNIAKRNNFSETAFINLKKSDSSRFSIRYFTPTEEIDICGHAALASFHVMKQLGYLKDSIAYNHTKAGEFKVIIEKEAILLQMKKPEIVAELTKNIVMETVDIGEDKIIPNKNGMIYVISTGLKDIILEVNCIDALKQMKMLRDRMITVCKKYKLIGMHVVSRETIEEDSDFCCRNFAPIVGIDEESATGTSNASLLYSMIIDNSKIDYNKTYKIEQGYFMNSPSNIYVKADKANGSIYVGGIARTDNIEEIVL